MNTALLLAKITVPRELGIPLAILGGIAIVLTALYFGYKFLGPKGTAALGAVALLAIFGLAFGKWRENASYEEARAISKQQTDALARFMDQLPGETTFEAACSKAGPWVIDQVVLTYPRPGQGLSHVKFYTSGQHLSGSDDSQFPSRFPADPLPAYSVVVVTNGPRAGLVDLPTGKLLCGGTLPTPSTPSGMGGFNSNSKAYFAALQPVCKRLGDGVCERMQRTPTY